MQLGGVVFRDVKNCGESLKGGESVGEYDISGCVYLFCVLDM